MSGICSGQDGLVQFAMSKSYAEISWNVGLLPPPIELRRRRATEAAGRDNVLEHYDPLGIAIGERFQDRVDDRENRGIAGNAQRQPSE